MVSIFKRVIFTVLQCTWGILQTLAGAAVFLVLIKRKHFIYRAGVATLWQRGESLSLGLFFFVSEQASEDRRNELCAHEYGHSVQSVILGPLFLPVIGLPSSVWCMMPYFGRLRAEKGRSYYSLYTERWANAIAEKLTGKELKLLK
ncbi:MAG: hypothetical protein IJU82_08725 [Ruminiclostridium sp.]|nr:hypothetical protein [Ruminiclostridium sp.]